MESRIQQWASVIRVQASQLVKPRRLKRHAHLADQIWSMSEQADRFRGRCVEVVKGTDELITMKNDEFVLVMTFQFLASIFVSADFCF
jgi:hypothetical protein